MNYKVGFIGCGHISYYHAEVLKSLGVTLQAVSARKGSKNIRDFSEKYGIENRYDDWEKMINDQNLDAIWVLASEKAINENICKILEYGIDSFFEKPVGFK